MKYAKESIIIVNLIRKKSQLLDFYRLLMLQNNENHVCIEFLPNLFLHG